jgi:hypothetical protein
LVLASVGIGIYGGELKCGLAFKDWGMVCCPDKQSGEFFVNWKLQD